MKNYYAGFNDMSTDVYVFDSPKERDEWVAGINEIPVEIECIVLSAKDAKIIAGKNFRSKPEYDECGCRVYRNWSVS